MVFRDDRRQQGPPQLLEDMTALCTGRSSPYPYTGCGCTTGREDALPCGAALRRPSEEEGGGEDEGGEGDCEGVALVVGRSGVSARSRL